MVPALEVAGTKVLLANPTSEQSLVVEHCCRKQAGLQQGSRTGQQVVCGDRILQKNHHKTDFCEFRSTLKELLRRRARQQLQAGVETDAAQRAVQDYLICPDTLDYDCMTHDWSGIAARQAANSASRAAAELVVETKAAEEAAPAAEKAATAAEEPDVESDDSEVEHLSLSDAEFLAGEDPRGVLS